MEGLKNMMEDNVERMLNKLLPTMPHICSCNDCRLDMATYALKEQVYVQNYEVSRRI